MIKKILKKRIFLELLKSKLIIVGIPAIIKNPKGEILLGKRSKKVEMFPDFWGLPGGLAERGETINQAIQREIKEELGIKTKVTKHGKNFMQMPSKGCKTQTLNIPAYCKITGKQKPKPLDETSEVKWFSPKEIRKMNLAYSHKEILKQEKII